MLKGYRTQIWNSFVAVIGVLEAADMSFIPDQYKGQTIVIIACVSAVLRQITTTPVGGK